MEILALTTEDVKNLKNTVKRCFDDSDWVEDKVTEFETLLEWTNRDVLNHTIEVSEEFLDEFEDCVLYRFSEIDDDKELSIGFPEQSFSHKIDWNNNIIACSKKEFLLNCALNEYILCQEPSLCFVRTIADRNLAMTIWSTILDYYNDYIIPIDSHENVLPSNTVINSNKKMFFI